MLPELQAVLGDRLDVSPATLESVRSDRSGYASAGTPLGVVHAETVADVQATLRWASTHGVPVVTRGAGTGLAGAATAGPGEIVLSTARMTRVLEINDTDLLAVVEPGIINADLNDILAEHGLWFAPDPASRAISTVGGNIATNAGGLLCAKYGVTREAVLALDVVLADGSLISLGHRSIKGVTGLDLTALMVGSEGLLGVIVGATVRLRRSVPGELHTIAAYFPSVTAAAEASVAIGRAGLTPAIMELLDATCLATVHAHLGRPTPPLGQSQLVLRTDGPDAREAAERALVILREHGGIAELAATAQEGEDLLVVRRAMHPSLETLGYPLIEDVSVPRSRLAEMFVAIEEVSARFGIPIPTLAHAGDGNLHPNLIVDGPEVPERVWEAAHALFQACLALGGTLSGEHGIGVLKQRWLAEELGDTQHELQRRIKLAFDPQSILNPGKVFSR
ncbi:FAD-binding protein [Mycetocola tolaasinivorans]|uniref:FAD-binding protein n=1 Tax=Mycetocola tolaasinivorans TaxID=76635 RepID=A0A3L7AC07_9MICO|nr:FAD-linked oxidase C-terminal domain-containing protein [Mycetocola tolaasinivorans]RLP77340.1 FAD-binding protein [Mycetocola tolaasinivorans]